MEDKSHSLPGEAKEYNLRCEVLKIKQNYEEIADGKKHETS